MKASTYLIRTGRLWFIIATIGLFAFGLYVILYYATTAATGHFDRWNKNLFSGIIPGEGLGNVLLVSHILLASIILFGGPLQLMHFIRNRFRTFHRWLGRTYVILAILIGLSGVVMTILGKSFGTMFVKVATCLSSIYICWFAVMTFKNAIKRNIQVHRQWALRLFMIANGVWFIRVWPSAWHRLFEKFGAYPEKLVAFFTFIFPVQLLVLELYFAALKKKQPRLQWLAIIIISLFTLVMAVGVYGNITSWAKKVMKVY